MLIRCSENIHLQPYSSETDFYERIYPKYLALLDKAKVYLDETDADPERTIILVRSVQGGLRGPVSSLIVQQCRL